MHPYYYGNSGPMMVGHPGVGGILIGVFFCVFGVMAIVWFVRMMMWRSRSGYYHQHLHDSKQPEVRTSPIDILKKRLAKGEITKEQYEDLKKVIET